MPAENNFLLRIEKRNLDAVDLGDIVVDHREAGFRRIGKIFRPPIALESRIKHLAQPVQDNRMLGLGQNTGINLHIIIRRFRHAHQRPARHQDDAAAELLNGMQLFEIGLHHVIRLNAHPMEAGDRCRSRKKSAMPLARHF